MNRLFVVLLVGLLGIMLPSCKGGVHLSQREAKKIITAHFKYPIIVSKRIDVREEGVEMLQYLKNEGYIAPSPITTCCGDYYPTTAKGKPYLGETIKKFSGDNLFFDCGCVKREIKAIKGIVIDKKTRSATVEYVEGLAPNEPIFSIVTKQYRGATPGIDFNETQTIKVKLKQFAEGWRIEESPAGLSTGATNPKDGGVGNAYAMIFVNTADPTTPLVQAQIDMLAYADCTAGGMMMTYCMSGTTEAGYGTLGAMNGYPISQVITKQ